MNKPVVALAAILFAAFAVAATVSWVAEKVPFPAPPLPAAGLSLLGPFLHI